MSAKDRAQREAERREKQFARASMEGLRQCLNSPDGRAFIWALYSDNADSEGEADGVGRRAVARDILKMSRYADFPALQIMREEWEQPRAGAQAEDEPEDE